MKISEIIKVLERNLKEIGDVEVHTEQSDGRESWVSYFKPKLTKKTRYNDKIPKWYLDHDGY